MVADEKILNACEILYCLMLNHPEFEQPAVEFKPEMIKIETLPVTKFSFFTMSVKFIYGGRIFSVSKNEDYAKRGWLDFVGEKEIVNMAKDAALQAGFEINSTVNVAAYPDIDEPGYVCIEFIKNL